MDSEPQYLWCNLRCLEPCSNLLPPVCIFGKYILNKWVCEFDRMEISMSLSYKYLRGNNYILPPTYFIFSLLNSFEDDRNVG